MSKATSDWGTASEFENIAGQIAIVGVGEADQSKASGRTTLEIAAQAVGRAIADAGLTPKDWHKSAKPSAISLRSSARGG